MPLSILCSVSSVAGIKSKSIPGVITAASFVLPTALGSISIQGITGTYTSFTVSRTGGGLANFTSTIQNFPTNSFIDPTALNNNSQYTYTIAPTNNGVAGTTFSAITNTNTGLSNGLIYSLASAPTLTYNGAGSSTSAISFTFTGGSYTNLSVQFPSGTFIATTTVSPYTGGSFGANTQNTYYVFAINGDNYGGLTAVGTGTNVTASSTSVNVCTWASAPTLTYNGAGSSTSAISFTYSGGTFSSLSIQTTLGTQITTITTSPYTSPSIYSINQQITYYACPVNALGYYSTSTNYATVNVCTWASAPTLSYNGAGSSQNAISFTYSGGTFSSLSIQTTLGTQITTITTSPYTSPSIYSINQQITYYACPVNALGYYSTSTNYASESVCTWATITAAAFVTPNVLGRIFNGTSTLTGITGTFTSYILTRTGGSQGTYTLSGQSGSTVTDVTTGLTNNTAYTFTLTPINQLNYNGTVFTSITGSTTSGIIYTLAAATMSPTLVNASGSTTSVFMSWTNTGYSSIRIQNTTTSGTISTFTTGSGTTTYNSNSVGALSTNTQYTYTFTAVNGDGNFLVGTTSTTLGTCTWASCNAPTFASTTSSGTTLTDTGTFSKVLINYSGGTATPASGTTFTGTNTVTQAYTLMASSTLYTFVCFPVNALSYQSSNSASAGVTTSASTPSPVLLGTYTVAWSFPSGGSTRRGYSIACSATGQYVSFCCNLRIYYSSNGGVSFNTYTSTNNMYAITMSSSGQYQLAVSTGIPACSIYLSTNFGVTWAIPKPNVTLNNFGRWFQSVCISSDGTYMFCGGSGGAGLQSYRSNDFGSTWSGAIGGILGRNSCAILNSSGLVYASQNLGNPVAIMSITTTTETTGATLPAQVWFITSNGSNKWYYINSSNNGFYSSNSGSTYGSAVSAVAIGSITNIVGLWYNSAGTRIWAANGSNNNLYYSTDNGTNWTTVTTGLSGIYGFNISSNSNTAYILLTSGAIYSLNISGY